MKMRKRTVLGAINLMAIMLVTLVILGCGGKSDSVVGTWSDDSGEVLVFEEGGTCSVPFTYNSGWLESCDNYVVKDDGTLILSSSKGNIRPRTYERTDSKDEALSTKGHYYLTSDELVINQTEYER